MMQMERQTVTTGQATKKQSDQACQDLVFFPELNVQNWKWCYSLHKIGQILAYPVIIMRKLILIVNKATNTGLCNVIKV